MTGTWPTGVASSIAVKVGTTQISYAVKATDTQADVVNGLNAAFANAGFALEASVERHRHPGEQRRRTGTPRSSTSRGTARTFNPFAGTDVAGTIDGQRDRQRPAAPRAVHHAGTRAGWPLNIAGTTLGDLGTFNYTPGHRAAREHRGGRARSTR